MKKILKLIIKFFAKILIQFLVKFNAGRYFIDEISNFIFQNKKIIEHKDLKLCFYVPNRLNFFRVDTFSSKEPETLKWIDTFKKQNVFCRGCNGCLHQQGVTAPACTVAAN